MLTDQKLSFNVVVPQYSSYACCIHIPHVVWPTSEVPPRFMAFTYYSLNTLKASTLGSKKSYRYHYTNIGWQKKTKMLYLSTTICGQWILHSHTSYRVLIWFYPKRSSGRCNWRLVCGIYEGLAPDCKGIRCMDQKKNMWIFGGTK